MCGNFKCEHRFEPRFDEGMDLPRADIKGVDIDMLKCFRYKKYVCDVCIKCGKVVHNKYH